MEISDPTGTDVSAPTPEEVVAAPEMSDAGSASGPLVQEAKTEIDTSSITAKYRIRFIEITPFPGGYNAYKKCV